MVASRCLTLRRQPLKTDNLPLMLGDSAFHDISVKVRKNEKQKHLIAKSVAELIGPGENEFINSGTTGLYLLNYIAGKNVRIVSNNAAIPLLNRSADSKLTITGGEHFVRTQSFVGPVAKSIITSAFANKGF